MNTFTAQELADFYQKVADGGEIEYDAMPHGWLPSWGGPDIRSVRQDWRIKPTKKVIDLSVLVESGIDVELGDFQGVFFLGGHLTHIIEKGSSSMYRTFDSTNAHSYARPRMNHIHAWQGGDCPLPEGFNWTHDSDSREDIIAFEVLGLADGYVMPWEQDDE